MSNGTLEKLQERYNSNPRSLVFARLAEQMFETGNREQALGILERGISLNPSYITGYAVLAKLLRASGHSEKAGAVLRKLLSIDPYNIGAMLQLAELAFEQRKVKLGLAYLFQVLTIDPANPSAMEMFAIHSDEITQSAPELLHDKTEETQIPLEKIGATSFSLIGIETQEQIAPLPVVKTLTEDTVPEIVESIGLTIEEPEPVTMNEIETETIELFPEIDQILGKFEAKEIDKSEQQITPLLFEEKEKEFIKHETITDTTKASQQETKPPALEQLLPHQLEEEGGILDLGLSEELIEKHEASIETQEIPLTRKISEEIKYGESDWTLEFPEEETPSPVTQTTTVLKEAEGREEKKDEETPKDILPETLVIEPPTEISIEEKKTELSTKPDIKEEIPQVKEPLEQIYEEVKPSSETNEEKLLDDSILQKVEEPGISEQGLIAPPRLEPTQIIPEEIISPALTTEEPTTIPTQTTHAETEKVQSEENLLEKIEQKPEQTDILDEFGIPKDILGLLSGPVFDIEDTEEEKKSEQTNQMDDNAKQQPAITIEEIEQIAGIERRTDDTAVKIDDVEILDGISLRTEFTPPSDVEPVEGIIKRPDEPLGEIPDEEIESLFDKLKNATQSTEIPVEEDTGEKTEEEQPTTIGKGYHTPTMAEIYAAQGLTEKAIEIYETLLASSELSPEERERFQKRVEMLRKRILK